MKFTDIKRFEAPPYAVDVPWDTLERHLIQQEIFLHQNSSLS
jgi:hypothetical protein